MVLTKQELLHLNAVLKDAEDTKILDIKDKEILMVAKKIREDEYDNYLDQIVKDVEDIKRSGIFPDLECVFKIHDHIEKETKEEFKEIPVVFLNG